MRCEGAGPAAEELLGRCSRISTGCRATAQGRGDAPAGRGVGPARRRAADRGGSAGAGGPLLLEKPDGAAEHVLTGAILCFPSNWTLAQKFGMRLARIHLPVERYDEAVARRVQRLFDACGPRRR